MLQTTSQLLSYHQQLEEQQATLYQKLAQKYPQHADVFEKLAKDSLRHRDMAQRAYREGVTDAFEVGFLANPLATEEYVVTGSEEDLTTDIVTMIFNEEIIIRFCLDASSSSSKLLPDVPETFERLVKRKKRGIERLRELI